MLPAGFYLIQSKHFQSQKAPQTTMSPAQVQFIENIQQLVDFFFFLHRYLSADHEDDLRVRVPWNLAHADSVHEMLYRERRDKSTASYDPERRILTVKAREEHSRCRVFCVTQLSSR